MAIENDDHGCRPQTFAVFIENLCCNFFPVDIVLNYTCLILSIWALSKYHPDKCFMKVHWIHGGAVQFGGSYFGGLYGVAVLNSISLGVLTSGCWIGWARNKLCVFTLIVGFAGLAYLSIPLRAGTIEFAQRNGMKLSMYRMGQVVQSLMNLIGYMSGLACAQYCYEPNPKGAPLLSKRRGRTSGYEGSIIDWV